MGALRRATKERLEASWEVMKAEASESAARRRGDAGPRARGAGGGDGGGEGGAETTRLAHLEAKANGESAVNAAREDAKRQTEELWKEVHAARQRRRR